MELIRKYFPHLSNKQFDRFEMMLSLYESWNKKINVISRKDIDNFYEHHVLHSLAIAKFIQFHAGSKILDFGTGGGFPGIPLAIVFPDVQFQLIDSIEKKITVVQSIINDLDIKNAVAIKRRAEITGGKFDFVVARAVTALPEFYSKAISRISDKSNHEIPNGIIYLKGGDFSEELKEFKIQPQIINISNYFEEDFFVTKKIVLMNK
jgi:16S rRNA (guanine527-N7)-methyltransferase